jgi:eukaryotic-like serine/threonine-protein kinase
MSPPEDPLEQSIDSALTEFLGRLDSGEVVDRESFLLAHPEIAPQLREFLEAADWVERLAGPKQSDSGLFPPESPGQFEQPVAQPQNPVAYQSANDFSVDKPNAGLTDSTAHIPMDDLRDAVSLSNPGRILVSPYDSTLPPTNVAKGQATQVVSKLPKFPTQAPGVSSVASDLVRAGPENTQPVLPCQFGEYVLERILGRGGMGVVYLARQIKLERPVAIKMIRSGCLANDNEIQRFYAEARSAARLDHPNIVSVYQCGEIDGHHYFSMDYIAGTDLAKRIVDGPIEPRRAAGYVRDVARAIAYAHEQGILHRDLKPANVLIDPQDEIVITDFGLAKLMGSEASLTQSGAALGTPSYMPPEQATGQSKQQTATTDVYSMGAVLFAALSGQPPFYSSSSMQTIMDVMHKPPPSLRQLCKGIPIELETIVEKCLRKDPSERYATANELADELERYLDGKPILARPLSVAHRSFRWLMHVPILAALFGFQSSTPSWAHRWVQHSLLGLLVLLTGLLFFGRDIKRWWNDISLPDQVVVASGLPEGAYYRFAKEFVVELSEEIKRPVSVQATQGSRDNFERLMNGEANLAMLQGTLLRGPQIAVVAPLYYEAFHVIAKKDRLSLADLSQCEVAVGAAGSGTHQAFELLLRTSPETMSDIIPVEVDWTELDKKKELQAALAVVRIGHDGIESLLKKGGFHLLSLEDVERISLLEPSFRPFQIGADEYPTVDTPRTTLATPAFLAARPTTSNRFIRACLQTIYQTENPIEGLIPIEVATHWQGLPLHHATRRYFETTLEKSRQQTNR